MIAKRKKSRVLITSRSFGRFCKDAEELVAGVADVHRVPRGATMEPDKLMNAVKGAKGLIVGADKISREVIEDAEELRIIARHGIGFDNIDVKFATQRGIVVTYTPHVNADSVADFTLGLMLSLARKIPWSHTSTQAGRWESVKFIGNELSGKTLGILGLGEIGSRVASRASTFGIKVVYYQRHRDERREKELNARYVPLRELLGMSDFLSIHVPLTDTTRGMIGEQELKLMKPVSFLINTARGQIVDENALYAALRDRRIAGAALDVYVKEPPVIDFSLFKLDNVIVTPHIAAYTHEAIERMDMTVAQDLVLFLQNKRPQHVANPEVLEQLDLT